MRKFMVMLALTALFATGCDQATEVAKDAGNSAANAAQNAVDQFKLNGVDLKGKATEMVTGLKDILGKVKDAASAEAAKPGLEGILKTVTGLSESVDNLPGAARQAFSGMFSESMPGLKEIIDKVSSMEGVGAILKPILDQIMEKLLLL